jgi:hypothetical protein
MEYRYFINLAGACMMLAGRCLVESAWLLFSSGLQHALLRSAYFLSCQRTRDPECPASYIILRFVALSPRYRFLSSIGAFSLSVLGLLFHILPTTPAVCCVRVNYSKRDKGKFRSLKKPDIMYYGESSLEKSAGEKINKISSRHMVGLWLLKVSSISSTSFIGSTEHQV